MFYILQGFTETVLPPLQASSVLLQAERRRVALDPPLPPITIDQIQCGELSTLLEEDDYNLASMVNIKLYILYTNYLDYYLSSESLVSSFYPFNSNLFIQSALHQFLHVGYYTPSFISYVTYNLLPSNLLNCLLHNMNNPNQALYECEM